MLPDYFSECFIDFYGIVITSLIDPKHDNCSLLELLFGIGNHPKSTQRERFHI